MLLIGKSQIRNHRAERYFSLLIITFYLTWGITACWKEEGPQSSGRNWLNYKDAGDCILATGPRGAACPSPAQVTPALRCVPF